MKLKPILCATLALLLGASLAVTSRAKMDRKNHGLQVKENGVKPMEPTAQAPTVIVSCPDQLQVGPVGVPNGWQSMGSLPRNRFSIKVDTADRSIICEYANEAVAFQSYYIARKIPPGYECKVPYPLEYRAVCTMNPRARPKQ